MASNLWVGGPARAARQWLAQRRLAAQGLAVRELAADELRPLKRALRAPDPGPGALDLRRQASQELCIAAASVGSRPVGVGLLEWAGPRLEELHGPWAGVPEIHRLHVLPAYRSLRVGVRLIDFLEQRALQRGKTGHRRLEGRAGAGLARNLARCRRKAEHGASTLSGDTGMKPVTTITTITKPDPLAPEGEFNKLIDEQLELAAARLPALSTEGVHPSPVDHDERKAAHPTMEDVLLGRAETSPEMLEELAALQAAPALSDEELARQALADGGADGDPSTPE